MNRTIPITVALLSIAQACATTHTNYRVSSSPSGVGGGPSSAATSQPSGVTGDEVPAGTRILAQMETTLYSGSAKNGDAFTATVGSPVVDASGNALIPAGSSIVGRVWNARSGRFIFGRIAHFTLGVDGAYIHGTFVPLSADVVSADVRTNRAGLIVRERATIPAGTAMEFALRQPVPVASLLHASMGGAAMGGGPKR